MNDWNHDESTSTGEQDSHAEQVFGEEARQATETVDGEVVAEPSEEKKPFGEDAAKFVVDAGYALAGFAGLVGEKAKAFYDEQKAEYAKTHPDTEAPGARQFFEQLGTHLNKFVDEINRGFRELSEKGRDVVGRGPEKSTEESKDADPKTSSEE